ncbi:hypothetical protein [Rhodopseudomonas pseudopalustris]|uniref:hypothetical protein n=1 Tax=Rhodopseudomonas pseudopalustris TaxID=1513892 RepID=UPI000B84FE4B|nr:hypothetical protein [Rhodopseudomonas pseudopalustris]
MAAGVITLVCEFRTQIAPMSVDRQRGQNHDLTVPGCLRNDGLNAAAIEPQERRLNPDPHNLKTRV